MQSLHFTAVTLQQCLRDIRADRSHVTPQHSSRVTCHEPRVTSPATTNQPAPVWCRLEAPQVPTESIKSCSVAEWVRWRPYIPGCSSHTDIVNSNNSNSDDDFIFPHTTIF